MSFLRKNIFYKFGFAALLFFFVVGGYVQTVFAAVPTDPTSCAAANGDCKLKYNVTGITWGMGCPDQTSGAKPVESGMCYSDAKATASYAGPPQDVVKICCVPAAGSASTGGATGTGFAAVPTNPTSCGAGGTCKNKCNSATETQNNALSTSVCVPADPTTTLFRCCVPKSTSASTTGGPGSSCIADTVVLPGLCLSASDCTVGNSDNISGTSGECNTGLGCCYTPAAANNTATNNTATNNTAANNTAANGASGGVSCPGGTIKSGVCFPATGLPSTSISVLLMTLMNWLLAIFGFVAIGAFVVSGLQYMLAAGNEDMAETAKHNMQYSMIGVAVGLSGYVILSAISNFLNASPWF